MSPTVGRTQGTTSIAANTNASHAPSKLATTSARPPLASMPLDTPNTKQVNPSASRPYHGSNQEWTVATRRKPKGKQTQGHKSPEQRKRQVTQPHRTEDSKRAAASARSEDGDKTKGKTTTSGGSRRIRGKRGKENKNAGAKKADVTVA